MTQKHQVQPASLPVTSDGRRRLQLALEAQIVAAGASGVTTFNTRSGAVALTSSDVTTALTFTPQPAGTYASGTGSASGVNTGDQVLPTRASLGLGVTNDVTFRDVTFTRGDGVGLIFFGNTGNTYLFYNGASFSFIGGPLSVSNAILSSGGGGIGYATGAGGAVTQLTSRTNGVTIEKPTGAITLFNKATTAGLVESFTVTNGFVVATDTINLSVRATGVFFAQVTNVASGSFRISIFTPAAETAQAPIINFAIIKSVVA